MRLGVALASASRSRISMFGDRLSSADFAFYGQMTPGAHAPGASPVMRDEAPMTFSWLIDMSGWEPGPWQDQEQPPCQAVMDLLGLCGEAYLPFFKANADALQASDEEVAVDI